MNSLLDLGCVSGNSKLLCSVQCKESRHKLICKYVYEFFISKIFPYMHASVCVLRYIKTSLKCFVLAFHTAVGPEHICQSSYSINHTRTEN